MKENERVFVHKEIVIVCVERVFVHKEIVIVYIERVFVHNEILIEVQKKKTAK